MTETANKPSTPVMVGQNLLDLVKTLEEQPGVAANLSKTSPFGALRSRQDFVGLPITFPIPFSYLAKASSSETTEKKIPVLDHAARSKSSTFLSFWDYHEKYLDQSLTPTQVANRVIASIEASAAHEWVQPVDKEDILRQAAASTERYKNKQHKSQLDGIFMVFKEDQFIKDRVTTAGTTFLNKDAPAVHDSTPVNNLRDAGVIIVGHARMNEIGWDTFSVNPNSGTPRNPYNLTCSSGGSSGGSAAAVAGGLVPISLGGDGGGSIRIPSSFCGVYGLKPTAGRVSGYGASGFGPSVGVIGPIATTADDLALSFSIISGADKNDPKTLVQPPFSLKDYNKTDSLEGLTIAVLPEWNKEVEVPAMVDHITTFVDHFKKLGANIVEIDIKDIDIARAAHSITISSEMNSFARRFPENHKDWLPYTRVMMALTNEATTADYVRAQQVRGMMMAQMEKIFESVDVIIAPVTGIQALDLPEGSLEHGLMDFKNTVQCTKFASLANFTGIPALSVPSGFNNDKPVGVHFMAGWYNESLLLRIAKVCEQAPGIERRKPKVSYSDDHLTV
ncbi:amidase signature domain-containing protein [Chlamydoabsidia padenii]|nr:amidase signature domain-containing protein [Chlamydoabsidia padenii]